VSFAGYSLNISTKEGLVMLSNRKEFFTEVVMMKLQNKVAIKVERIKKGGFKK